MVLEALGQLLATHTGAPGHVVALVSGLMDAEPPPECLRPYAVWEEGASLPKRLHQGPATRGSLCRNEPGSSALVGPQPDGFEADPAVGPDDVTEQVPGWHCRRRKGGLADGVQVHCRRYLGPASRPRVGARFAVGCFHDHR